MLKSDVLYIDASDALAKLDGLRRQMSPEQYQKAMYRTLKEVSKKANTIVKKEVTKKYEVTQAWVGAKIKSPRMSAGGMNVSCVIPVKGERGTIGGIFAAGGGPVKVQATTVHLKDGTTKQRKKHIRQRKITARIVKGQSSTLPDVLKNQGGNPPFRPNGGVVFTRTTAARLPIARVVGRDVPDMIDAKAREGVEKELLQTMENRFVHNAMRVLGGH